MSENDNKKSTDQVLREFFESQPFKIVTFEVVTVKGMPILERAVKVDDDNKWIDLAVLKCYKAKRLAMGNCECEKKRHMTYEVIRFVPQLKDEDFDTNHLGALSGDIQLKGDAKSIVTELEKSPGSEKAFPYVDPPYYKSTEVVGVTDLDPSDAEEPEEDIEDYSDDVEPSEAEMEAEQALEDEQLIEKLRQKTGKWELVKERDQYYPKPCLRCGNLVNEFYLYARAKFYYCVPCAKELEKAGIVTLITEETDTNE